MSLFRRSPKPIGNALQDYFDSLPNKKQLKRGLALTNWNEIVGERIALHTKELRYEGAKLIVRMDNPLWRQEVHAQRFAILNKLNQSVQDEVIAELIIKE